jgi:hypothetical protein
VGGCTTSREGAVRLWGSSICLLFRGRIQPPGTVAETENAQHILAGRWCLLSAGRSLYARVIMSAVRVCLSLYLQVRRRVRDSDSRRPRSSSPVASAGAELNQR